MDNLSKYVINKSVNIRDAIKKMDENRTDFIAAVNPDNKVEGVITEGDIRRVVLNGIDLNDHLGTILNKQYKFLNKGYARSEAMQHFKDKYISYLPVLHDGKLVDVVLRRNMVKDYKANIFKKRSRNMPVVIMAGGKGTRLDPFTRILPKPLLPIGNEPVIKIIMDEFSKFGMTDFCISLNEYAKMIRAYFQDHDYDYKIRYIEENKPLGTAGALKLLENKNTDAIFVTNCDVIIQTDYDAIYDFHKKSSCDLTLVGSMQQYIIPYGVCDIDSGGVLIDIKEKPEYDLLVNTGLYLMESSVLEYIPGNQYFDMTDLIKLLKQKGLKVGVYPVSKRSWIDVGQWSDYEKKIKELDS